MNNKRNLWYLVMFDILFIMIIIFLMLVSKFLNKSEGFFTSKLFIVSIALFLALWLMLILMSTYNLFLINRNYKYQYNKYKLDIILENHKREKSALLMIIFSSLFLYPVFVIMNTYLKSGLSPNQLKYAENQIRIKNVDGFLKQKNVQNALKKNLKIKISIDNVIKIRENNLDTQYNCNLFILKKLEDTNANYAIEYDQYELYRIGFNF